MASWDEYLHRAKQAHGDQLDLSGIASKFVPHFHGSRIKVRFGEMEMTGTVSVTTGWKPSLMLMRRRSDTGSMWLLSDKDELIAIQNGRSYVPTTEAV